MSEKDKAVQAEPGAEPSGIPVKRVLGAFLAVAALWTAIAGGIVHRVVEQRIAAYLAHERTAIEQRLAAVSEQFGLALNRLRGVPAVIAAGRDVISVLTEFGPDAGRGGQPLDMRRKNWTERSDLQALSRQFSLTATELEVDVVWAMNASGDCVAASNANTPMSFVGVNYSDRRYFTAPRAGERGYQYAMGRVTSVPGLYFSSPVTSIKGFIGVVTIKIDLPRLAPWVKGSDEFVTDENSVVILAGNSSRTMRVLDAAVVEHLSTAQRDARYKVLEFKALGIEALAEPGGRGLVRVAGSDVPHFFRSSSNTPEGLKLHILKPAHNLASIRRDGFPMFALLAFAGWAVAALVTGAFVYMMRVRQHRESLQTTNEALNRLNQDLERLSRTDALTGCANRRYFRERMESELERARRYHRSCCVLMLDIDWFKNINDQHGHAAGDEALQHIVRVIDRTVRNQDIVGRLGGEEFAVLMPETSLDNAAALAERLRLAVAAVPAQFGDISIPMTVSLGVAHMATDGVDENTDDFLRRADDALYAAKEAGRNCVMRGAPAQA